MWAHIVGCFFEGRGRGFGTVFRVCGQNLGVRVVEVGGYGVAGLLLCQRALRLFCQGSHTPVPIVQALACVLAAITLSGCEGCNPCARERISAEIPSILKAACATHYGRGLYRTVITTVRSYSLCGTQHGVCADHRPLCFVHSVVPTGVPCATSLDLSCASPNI